MESYYICLKLTIRAFSGLFEKHIDSKEHLENIVELINKIPSLLPRLRLLTDLSLLFLKYDRKDEPHFIVSNEIRPLIEGINDSTEKTPVSGK